MRFVLGLWTFLRASLFGSAAIALENLALRHQLAVLQRSGRRPRLSRGDRIFWVWLARLWIEWRASLVIVHPATVLAWHRQGFQLSWRWKSKPNPVGRPRLDAEIRHLIRRMAQENPTWGRRRIQAELALLGSEVAELTVAKDMPRPSPRPSPTGRTVLAAPARDIIAVDFFLVPTLTSRRLFVFVGLRHDRRELLSVNVTDHPAASWTPRQLVEAFPEDTAPNLLRDRDAIYGEGFARWVDRMAIREIRSAPHAPWQNPFVERVIGSIRREGLDHVLVLNEAHLRRLLGASLASSNRVRPHQALDHNGPRPRGHEMCSRQRSGAWGQFRRSAASITFPSARPDPGRSHGHPSHSCVTHHAAGGGMSVERLGFAGGRAWHSLIPVAPDAAASARRRIGKVGPIRFLTWTRQRASRCSAWPRLRLRTKRELLHT